jgi:hypothetical protein
MISRSKSLVLFILFVPGSFICMAQKWRTQTDSLLLDYKKATSPKEQVKLLTNAANIFLLQNPDTALLLSSEA